MSVARVAILMGSDSDWPKIGAVGDALREFDVPFEAHVMSAHRTPRLVAQFAEEAHRRGVRVIIAAAGGAAHLAGAVAAHSTLPVIGLPVPTDLAGGLDSLLAIAQMPGDVPVATVGVGMGGPRNAGLLAVQILATADEDLQRRLVAFKEQLAVRVQAKNQQLQTLLVGRTAESGR